MIPFLRACVVWILTLEARAVIARHKPKIIAITGSVGKTTTKDAVYAAISGSVHVRKSAKSFNSELGVPLTILGCETGWNDPWKWFMNIVHGIRVLSKKETYPEWLILEVGADRPGDIRSIARWLRPDIAIITGVPEVPVHVEYFSSPESVVREKRALAEYIKPGGSLILNGDDARSRTMHSAFKGDHVTYGFQPGTTYTISDDAVLYTDSKPVGMQCRISIRGEVLPVALYGALGRPRAYSAAAALAVADVVGVDRVDATKGLAAWEPTPGRMRLLTGIRNTVIIDDTYNSSPVAALAALDTLKSIKAKRRIALLGDMLELGRFSANAHREVGERAAKCTKILCTVGFRSRATAQAALDGGMKDENVFQYELDEASRAGREVLEMLKPGDVILVKGSQGMRMERAVLEIMEEPLKADELLVRMDDEWKHR